MGPSRGYIGTFVPFNCGSTSAVLRPRILKCDRFGDFHWGIQPSRPQSRGTAWNSGNSPRFEIVTHITYICADMFLLLTSAGAQWRELL